MLPPEEEVSFKVAEAVVNGALLAAEALVEPELEPLLLLGLSLEETSWP